MVCRLNLKMIFFISVMVCKLKKILALYMSNLSGTKVQVTGYRSHVISRLTKIQVIFRIYSRFSFFWLGGGCRLAYFLTMLFISLELKHIFN